MLVIFKREIGLPTFHSLANRMHVYSCVLHLFKSCETERMSVFSFMYFAAVREKHVYAKLIYFFPLSVRESITIFFFFYDWFAVCKSC